MNYDSDLLIKREGFYVRYEEPDEDIHGPKYTNTFQWISLHRKDIQVRGRMFHSESQTSNESQIQLRFTVLLHLKTVFFTSQLSHILTFPIWVISQSNLYMFLLCVSLIPSILEVLNSASILSCGLDFFTSMFNSSRFPDWRIYCQHCCNLVKWFSK